MEITVRRKVSEPAVNVTPTAVRLNLAARSLLGDPEYIQWAVSLHTPRIALSAGTAGSPSTYRITETGMTGIPKTIRARLSTPVRLPLSVLSSGRLCADIPDVSSDNRATVGSV